MPNGSRARLTSSRHRNRRPTPSGKEAGPVEADAVMVADGAAAASVAAVTASQARAGSSPRSTEHFVVGRLLDQERASSTAPSWLAVRNRVEQITVGMVAGERDVEAGARRRTRADWWQEATKRAFHGAEGLDHRAEQSGECRPSRSHFHGVDPRRPPPEGNERRDVRCAGPASVAPARRRAGRRRQPGTLRSTTAIVAAEQAGIGLVEDDEDVRVLEMEIACRLGRVVEAEHRRRRPNAGAPAGRLRVHPRSRRTRRHVSPGPRGPGGAGGRASVMTPKVPSLPTKSCERSGPDGGTGGVSARPYDGPIRQDDLDTTHHVLDLPVAGGVLAGSRHASQPPTVESAIDCGQ